MGKLGEPIKLPSGATLRVGLPSFSVSKDLHKAVLKAGNGVDFNAKKDVLALCKEMVCVGFSDDRVEKCVWECFEKCTYNGGSGDMRITLDTFEPAEAREDYVPLCIKVLEANLAPFVKGLSAELSGLIQQLMSVRASRPETPTS